jgi:phosphatidylethanolamine-binding protein (PEBP) family uncharacterized protein
VWSNPPLRISGLAPEVQSLVLIAECEDANGAPRTHWVVYNMPPVVSIPADSTLGDLAVNDFERHAFVGPAHSAGGRPRFVFRLFALDCFLDIGGGKGRGDVENAMAGHILAQAELPVEYLVGEDGAATEAWSYDQRERLQTASF